MIYGLNLKKIRESNNLTQNDLAKILSIGRTTYTEYEDEYKIIPLKHLNILCNFFNVSIDYIFSFTNITQYENNINDIDTKLSGKRLKELRKNNNLTLEALSKDLNCSYGTIAGYELGRYLIATPFLYTICKKYNISADYLLGKINEFKKFY